MKKFFLTGLLLATFGTSFLVSCSSEENDVTIQEGAFHTKSNEYIDRMPIDPPKERSVKTVLTHKLFRLVSVMVLQFQLVHIIYKDELRQVFMVF